jgi:hypothetical protein
MNKYSIAFISPGGNLLHRLVMAKNEDEALRTFFKEVNLASYSQDEDGFYYFKEDFSYGERPAGNILQIN